MINNILSIILSIIAALLYDLIKKAYINRKQDTSVEHKMYSPTYILSVKKEFYIGFFLGIVLMSFPDTDTLFLNMMFDIVAYFFFFIALMGFMCLTDVVNHMSEKSTDKNTDKGTDA